jgi:hypothetical protein
MGDLSGSGWATLDRRDSRHLQNSRRVRGADGPGAAARLGVERQPRGVGRSLSGRQPADDAVVEVCSLANWGVSFPGLVLRCPAENPLDMPVVPAVAGGRHEDGAEARGAENGGAVNRPLVAYAQSLIRMGAPNRVPRALKL